MPAIVPILIAAAAAGAILLIAMGLAGSSPVDPVQARLTQLGTMQAKNLEELELRAILERTLHPLAGRRRDGCHGSRQLVQERTEKRLARRHPGNLRADWLGIKAVGAVGGAILFLLLFGVLRVLGLPPVLRLLMGVMG
jgi:hypothetical protein